MEIPTLEFPWPVARASVPALMPTRAGYTATAVGKARCYESIKQGAPRHINAVHQALNATYLTLTKALTSVNCLLFLCDLSLSLAGILQRASHGLQSQFETQIQAPDEQNSAPEGEKGEKLTSPLYHWQREQTRSYKLLVRPVCDDGLNAGVLVCVCVFLWYDQYHPHYGSIECAYSRIRASESL